MSNLQAFLFGLLCLDATVFALVKQSFGEEFEYLTGETCIQECVQGADWMSVVSAEKKIEKACEIFQSDEVYGCIQDCQGLLDLDKFPNTIQTFCSGHVASDFQNEDFVSLYNTLVQPDAFFDPQCEGVQGRINSNGELCSYLSCWYKKKENRMNTKVLNGFKEIVNAVLQGLNEDIEQWGYHDALQKFLDPQCDFLLDGI